MARRPAKSCQQGRLRDGLGWSRVSSRKHLSHWHSSGWCGSEGEERGKVQPRLQHEPGERMQRSSKIRMRRARKWHLAEPRQGKTPAWVEEQNKLTKLHVELRRERE